MRFVLILVLIIAIIIVNFAYATTYDFDYGYVYNNKRILYTFSLRKPSSEQGWSPKGYFDMYLDDQESLRNYYLMFLLEEIKLYIFRYTISNDQKGISRNGNTGPLKTFIDETLLEALKNAYQIVGIKYKKLGPIGAGAGFEAVRELNKWIGIISREYDENYNKKLSDKQKEDVIEILESVIGKINHISNNTRHQIIQTQNPVSVVL